MRMVMLQEGGSLPGPETGLLSNTQKWIVWGDTCADKARDFIGKGSPDREQEGKGTQENFSATWLAVSGFMMMVLVFRLPLANQSDSLSQDGYRQEGFWEVVGHVVSPFDLSWTLPVGGGLLVPVPSQDLLSETTRTNYGLCLARVCRFTQFVSPSMPKRHVLRWQNLLC